MQDPKIIGFKRKGYEEVPRIIRIGFPPAGGWVTPSNIITNIARPTAIAICKYWSIGKNCKIKIPTNDVLKWPKNMFFGWEKGLSGYPKTSTIVAPKDPTTNKPYWVFKLKNERDPMVIPENINANKACLKFFFIKINNKFKNIIINFLFILFKKF